MRIAIDVSPLSSARSEQHKVRGSGFYITHLLDALKKYIPNHEFLEFTGKMPQADMVHYPYFEPFFLTLPGSFVLPTIVTVHDLTPIVFQKYFPAGLKGNIRWQFQKRRLRKTTVITDSESSRSDIVKIVGIREKNIHVVPLAAGENFKRIQNHDASIKLVSGKFKLPEKFVLYVGDATWNKNLPRLIEAIIQSKLPFVMVGKALAEEHVTNHPWNRDLLLVQQKARDHDNIHFLGYVTQEELVALYSIATVFVMPSVYEGFGLPILEAMMCGVPVVTSKGGSLVEVAGDAAIFVDPYSSEALEKSIQEVFQNDELQKKLREKGFKQAEKFSWEKTAKATAAVYESLAAR